MTDADEMLALNELTGLVHTYEGTGLGGVGVDENDMGIGLLSCGCDGFEEAAKNDTLTMIRRKHLERGIWQAAPCLSDGD